MKYLMVLILVAAVAIAVDPIGKNENNILYGWNGFDYTVYRERAGLCSYTATVNGGSSTIYGWLDWSSTTYDHVELYIEAAITGDATDEDMKATLYWYPAMTCSTWTVADTLNFVNLNDDGSDMGTLRYTVVPDAASIAARHAIATLVPGERYILQMPIWYNCSATGDSTGTGFGIAPNDSCEVTYTIMAIPRT